MISLEDNPLLIGEYEFEKHEGNLNIYDVEDHMETYYPVDYFSDLIDALYHFKEKGYDVKLTGAEFKRLVEGSNVSMYVHYCEGCDKCKGEENCNNVESRWVNFNRYDFIKDYGVFRRLALIQDDYTCLCCGNTNEKDLQVHHIKSFKNNLELATDLKNSAVLCKDCHTKYHKKYGYNATHKTFKKFIRENRE